MWKSYFCVFFTIEPTLPLLIIDSSRERGEKKLFMFHLNMYGINIYYFPSFPFTILHVFPFCLCKNLFLLFFRWILCRSVRLRLIYRWCRFLWLRTRTQHISWIATNSCLHMVTEPEHTLLNPFLYLTFCRLEARWIMEKLIYEVLFENPTLKSLSLFAFRVKGFAEADFWTTRVFFQPRSPFTSRHLFSLCFYDQCRHILFHLISRD